MGMVKIGRAESGRQSEHAKEKQQGVCSFHTETENKARVHEGRQTSIIGPSSSSCRRREGGGARRTSTRVPPAPVTRERTIERMLMTKAASTAWPKLST